MSKQDERRSAVVAEIVAELRARAEEYRLPGPRNESMRNRLLDAAALIEAAAPAEEPITGPYAHLYTREEALKLMRYSSYETTKAGTSVLDFPALLDATVKR